MIARWKYPSSVSILKHIEPSAPENPVQCVSGHETSIGGDLRHVLFVEEHNLLVTACAHGKVFIYDSSQPVQLKGKFEGHRSPIIALLCLVDDILLSLDESGRVITWSARTTQFIGEWDGHFEAKPTSVTKLDDSTLILGTKQATLLFLSHHRGTRFSITKEVKIKRTTWAMKSSINQVTITDKHFLLTTMKDVRVLNRHSNEFKCMLKGYPGVRKCAASSDYVVSISGCDLNVYGYGGGFHLNYILRLNETVNAVTILSNSIVVVVGSRGIVSFISLSRKCYLHRIKLSPHQLYTFTVMDDCRIAVGGANGFCCLFSPPKDVHHAVEQHVIRAYPTSIIAFTTNNPIQTAWHRVRNGTLSIVDACSQVIVSELCSKSLDEWCYAHSLLMMAVRGGHVPASREYRGFYCYWHSRLYQHCAELAMGMKDIDVILQLFKEAEDAGVVGIGAMETFIDMVNVRRDIAEFVSYTSDFLQQLHLHQGAMESRLQQIVEQQQQEPADAEWAYSVPPGIATLRQEKLYLTIPTCTDALPVADDKGLREHEPESPADILHYNCNDSVSPSHDGASRMEAPSRILGVPSEKTMEKLEFARKMPLSAVTVHEGNWEDK